MENWNPLQEDFRDEKFNSYVRGPGKNLSVNRGDKKYASKQVQLYVTGIPNEVTEDGLLKLFSRSGKVVRAKKISSRRENAQDTYGFITMANAIDAEKAIREFNNFQIDRFQLRVRVSHNEQDKRRRPMEEELVVMGQSAFRNDSDSDPDEIAGQRSPAVNGYGNMPVQQLQSVGRGKMLQDLSSVSNRMDLASKPSLPQASPGQKMNLSITVDKDNHRVLSGPVGRGTSYANQDINYNHMGRGNSRYPNDGSGYQGGGYQENYNQDYRLRRGRGRGKGYGGSYGRGRPYQYQEPPLVYGVPMINPYPYGIYAAGASQSLLQPAFNPMLTPMISAATLAAAQQQQAVNTSAPKKNSSPNEAEEEPPVNECSVCSKLGSLRCSRCKEPYCSQECQKKDWPQHKNVCKTISSEKSQSSDFTKQFDVSVGDELIPKVKELMEKAVGGKIEITHKTQASESKTGYISDTGSDRTRREPRKSQKMDRQKKGSGDSKDSGETKKSQDKYAKTGACLNCGSSDHRRRDCTKPEGINKECYACGSTGHLSKVCPTKQELCHNCHKPGHFSRECPEKSDKKSYTQAKEVKPVANGNVATAVNKPPKAKTPSPVPNTQSKNQTVASPVSQTVVSPVSQTKKSPVGGTRASLLSPPPKKTLPGEVLPLNEEVIAVVSEVIDPGHIWVQIATDERILGLGEIMNDMAKKLGSSRDYVSSVMVGEYYGGQYSVDQTWYRVRVTKMQGTSITVHFIDFGNEEITSADKLRYLEPSMIELPSQAILCCLEGIEPFSGTEWNISQADMMQHLAPNLPYPITCRKKVATSSANIHEVTIKNEKGESISQNLLSAHLVKPKLSSQPGSYPGRSEQSTTAVATGPLMVKDVPHLESMLTVGQEETVYITDAISPQCFCVQILEEEILRAFHEFNAKFNLHYNKDTTASYSPVVVGELVASRFSGDNDWYRGEVTEISGSGSTVVFLDFGNSERVDHRRLRAAMPFCATTPVQAVSCFLAGLEVQANFQWPPVIIEFYKSLAGQPLKAVVREKKNGRVAVELYTMAQESITEKIKDMLKAISGTVTNDVNEVPANIDIQASILPLNEKVEVVVTNIISLNKFYIQLSDGDSRLKLGKMWTELNEFCANSVVYEPEIGDFVAAQYTEGETTLWYRAKIVERVDAESYRAFFIDYGNTEVVAKTAVARLHARFADPPYLSVCCKLAGCEGKDSPKALEELSKCVDMLALANAVEFLEGGVSIELYQSDDTCINQKIIDLDNITTNTEPQAKASPPEPEVPVLDNNSVAVSMQVSSVAAVTVQESSVPLDGSQILGVIVFIESLSSFSVQLVNESLAENLKSLGTLNTVCENDGAIYEPAVNEYVAAKFTVDSLWYRAKVIDKTPAGIKVLFLDFGNRDTVPVENVRKHCTQFDTIPALAVLCSLAGSGQPDDKTKVEDFNAVLNNPVNIKAAEKVGDHYVVELFLLNDEATCVNTVLGLDTAAVQTHNSTKDAPQQAAQAVPASEPQASLLQIEQEKVPVGTPVAYAPVLINSVNEFYVQSAEEEKQAYLVQIFMNLRDLYLAVTDGYTPTVGEFVGVLFHDGTEELPYRGLVQEKLSDTEYQLYLIDYGNIITAKIDGIRKLDTNLFSFPQLASKCKLHGFNIDTEETKKEFSTVALTIEMSMTVKSCDNGVYEVELLRLDGKNITEHLLSIIGTASVGTELVDQLPKCITPPKEALPRKSASPTHGERTVVFAQTLTCCCPESDSQNVVITSVVRPNLFHCQVFQEDQSNLRDLKLLSDSMKLDCEHSMNLNPLKFEVGELCCAKFPEDGDWYRAQVLEVFPDDTAKVAYVDFGNQCDVPVNLLRPIRQEYTVLPLLAFKCSLHGVSPVSGSWTKEASMKLKEYQDIPLHAKVVQVDSDMYELEIEDMEGQSVGQQLIKAGVASPSKPDDSGKEDDVAHLERKNQMLQQQLNDMQAMMAKLLKQ